MKVTQLINNNGNPASNQFVIYDNDNNIYFQSYETLIAKYDVKCKKLFVTNSWDYSNTTRKHFYIFLNDFTKYGYIYNKDSMLKAIKNGEVEVVDSKFFNL